jgi:hypothetical protein
VTNDWTLGALYPLKGGQGGFWAQPGGPNTTVFPQEATGNTDYFSTTPFNELTGQYMGVCDHSFNQVMVFRDYDYDNSISVALLCCPLCGCVQRTLSPYETATTGSDNASLANLILFP